MQGKNRMTMERTFWRSTVLIGAVGLGLSGCAQADEDTGTELTSNDAILATAGKSIEVTPRPCAPNPPDGSVPPVDPPDESKPPPVDPSDGPTPPAFPIPGLDAFGRGCRPANTRLSAAADGKSFTAEFSKMSLNLTGGTNLETTDCTIDVPLARTATRTYALQEVVLHGTATTPQEMDFGVVSFLRLTGFGPVASEKRTALRGPQSGDFTLTEHFDIQQTVLPCAADGLQAAVGLAADLRDMRSGKRAGSATISRADFKFAEVPCVK